MKARKWMVLLLGMVTAQVMAEPIQVVTEESQFITLKNGRIGGAATEVVELTLNRAGQTDYKINLYPWARAYDIAINQPNVLIYLVARTPEREALFKWVGQVATAPYYFYKLRARTDINPQSLDDARQYSIGVMRNDFRHHYLLHHDFSRLVLSAGIEENFQKLLNEKVQLIPMTEGSVAHECARQQFDCTKLERVEALGFMEAKLYMAYSVSTDDAVVEKTRAAFKQLEQEGTVSRTLLTLQNKP
jgi:polar amino acid transport system substrate-binding protein